VNTKERTGCNVLCDLHLEHLNQRLETVVTSMHCDVKVIDNAAKAIGVIHRICEFESEGGKH